MIFLVKPCVTPGDSIKVDYHEDDGGWGLWYRAVEGPQGSLVYFQNGEEVGPFLMAIVRDSITDVVDLKICFTLRPGRG